ncbi:MAG: hypothetical protein PVJ76_21790, partial [Gemmatimonadota bacterium]
MASKLSLLLAEFRRRKVGRVAVAYVLVGLGAIEAVDIIGSRLLFPDWAIQFVIVLVLIGFPIALVLAWALEVTPQGIQKTADLTPEQLAAQAQDKWRASSWILAGISLVVVGLVGYCVLLGDSQTDLSPQTVAVMPFENLTPDEELDEVGKRASMVLTKALEKTGLVTVRNFDTGWTVFDYVTTEVNEGRATDRLSLFASEIGARTIVHGAYQFDGTEVCFDAFISDAATGRSIREINPVCG